jgi:hypothetical protein
MEVARRNGLDAEFSEAVRLMGARAALEEARRPKEKGLVEAAARGEKEARDVLMDRQPALYGAVISAAEGGAGEGFWSRLVAQAEARLGRVEAEAAKGRADRLQRTMWDSDVRRDLESLVAATAAGESVEPGIRRLAQRNADLARVAGDLLTGTPEDIARRSPALLAGMSGPIGREVRRLRDGARLRARAGRACRPTPTVGALWPSGLRLHPIPVAEGAGGSAAPQVDADGARPGPGRRCAAADGPPLRFSFRTDGGTAGLGHARPALAVGPAPRESAARAGDVSQSAGWRARRERSA